MAHLGNKLNEYALAGGSDLFDATPKAVWAAIAVSFATQGGGALEEARTRILSEWSVLHANDIVKQPVPVKFRAFAAA